MTLVADGDRVVAHARQASRSVLVWSLVIAVLVTTASLMGLTDESIYGDETDNWATQARGQDLGNLLAVTVLVMSGYRRYRGSHRAALVWLGTLLYLVYAYVVYSMAIHFNVLFLVYVASLGVTSFAVLFAVNGIRAEHQAFPPPAARRLAGFTAIVIGAGFALLWLSELVPATLSGEVPQSVREAGLWVNPIHVIDLAVLLPAFVVAGAQTLTGKASGEFFVAPLLTLAVLMGASIVFAMVLMAVDGIGNAGAPLMMMSVVVLASLAAAWRYLAGSCQAAPEGRSA
jgi:hypothetical protein